ncbi:vWA domain-containing protein [Actinophytocola glycyrrhizae]|uniref:VWA domain-containing protein n=1 Tax=Actinophytocola glycyrrhizae TaxID=2044873 RepID=A0ABV9S2W6_9PSEU
MADSPDSTAVPVYLVVDISASMAPLMGLMNDLLIDAWQNILADPLLADVVHLGVVSFSSAVSVDLPLTAADRISAFPRLLAGGATHYAAVFQHLVALLHQDVVALKANSYRVFRPAVFFLSDGRPLDESFTWSAALEKLKTRSIAGGPRIFSVGIGDADPGVVQEVASVSGAALMVRTGASSSEAIGGYFQLVDEYVKSLTRSVAGNARQVVFRWPENLVELPIIGK